MALPLIAVFVNHVLLKSAYNGAIRCIASLESEVIMYKRSRMNRHKSERNFTRNSGVHPKNLMRAAPAMRGGIRL